MEHPIKIDENWGYPYDEPETTIYCRLVRRPSQTQNMVFFVGTPQEFSVLFQEKTRNGQVRPIGGPLRIHCEAVKLHQVPLLEIRGEAKGGPETQLLAAGCRVEWINQLVN